MKHLQILVLILVVAFLLGACGKNGDASSTPPPDDTAVATDDAGTTTPIQGGESDAPEPSTDTEEPSPTSETLSPAPDTMSPDDETNSEFSPLDAYAEGIELDMFLTEVEEILGPANEKESESEGAFEWDVHTYFYDFGTVRFEPLSEYEYTVSAIYIDQAGYVGPRGIEVGDSYMDVVNKFPHGEGAISQLPDGYLYGEDGENFGAVYFGTGGKVEAIQYSYGGGGFGSYSLYLEIENNVVKTIRIGVMNV